MRRGELRAFLTLCSLRLIILLHSELLPDIFYLAAGHLALGTGGIKTTGARLGDYRRRHPFYMSEHALGHFPDLPLRPVTAPHTEKVQELTCVHSYNDLCLRRVRKQIPCVLLARFALVSKLFKPLQDLGIILLGLGHELLELASERRVLLDARRNHVVELLFFHIALALLRVRGHAVSN